MRRRTTDSAAERLIHRFAEACARRDLLLDVCRRTMRELARAADRLGGLEGIESYSIDDHVGSPVPAVDGVPAYPSRLELDACLHDLAAVSAEIRALRAQLSRTLAPSRAV